MLATATVMVRPLAMVVVVSASAELTGSKKPKAHIVPFGRNV
jgi:hypothetical protein